MQKYRPRDGRPAAAFQKWINRIEDGVNRKLLPALSQCDMLLSADLYMRAGAPTAKPLLQMSNFNGLIAKSQEHQSPIFSLTDAQLDQTGVVLEHTRTSMQKFRELFSDAADTIIRIIDNAKCH